MDPSPQRQGRGGGDTHVGGGHHLHQCCRWLRKARPKHRPEGQPPGRKEREGTQVEGQGQWGAPTERTGQRQKGKDWGGTDQRAQRGPNKHSKSRAHTPPLGLCVAGFLGNRTSRGMCLCEHMCASVCVHASLCVCVFSIMDSLNHAWKTPGLKDACRLTYRYTDFFFFAIICKQHSLTAIYPVPTLC